MDFLRFARGIYDVYFTRNPPVKLFVQRIKLLQITQGYLVVTRLTPAANVKIALIWGLV